MSFEDIDLIGPTGATLQATYEGNLEVEQKHDVPLSEKIQEISNVLYSASGVPLLSSYIQPVAWMTGVASGVLSAFGWSKPVTTVTPSVYHLRARGKYNHADGTDIAEPLAMTTTTGVKVTDQLGFTDQDEMSFKYLLGINSVMYRGNFNIALVSGTRLIRVPLCPYYMQAGADIPGSRILHPVAYAANVYNKYRGSFRITVTLSKTVFHTGRLLAVFEPYCADPVVINAVAESGVDTPEDAINCHKDLIDLRKGNSFSLVCPFTSLTPYLNTFQPYGTFSLFIQNPVVRNDAGVSDIVDYSISVACCDDFEFASPSNPRLWPITLVVLVLQILYQPMVKLKH